MFEKLKALIFGKQDDVIRTPEDLQRAIPDLKIFVLPELPEVDLKLYRGPEEDESESK